MEDHELELRIERLEDALSIAIDALEDLAASDEATARTIEYLEAVLNS